MCVNLVAPLTESLLFLGVILHKNLRIIFIFYWLIKNYAYRTFSFRKWWPIGYKLHGDTVI